MAASRSGFHGDSLQARCMPQNTPDAPQGPTIPSPRLYSGRHFPSIQPGRPSQLANEWALDAAAQSTYRHAELRSKTAGNSTSPQYPQFTSQSAEWGSTSSLHDSEQSPMTLYRTSHGRFPTGNPVHVSEPFPWSPVEVAEQTPFSVSNCTEEPVSASGWAETGRTPKHQSVEPRHSTKQRYYRSCLAQPRKPSWRLTPSGRTAFQSFNCEIDGCHTPFNNSCSLKAHLELHEQSHRAQPGTPFRPPASVFSINSTDSGYVSLLDVAPLSFSPQSLNTPTSVFLWDGILVEYCDVPYARAQLECDEDASSSNTWVVNGLKDEISFEEGHVPITTDKVPVHRQLSLWEEAENEWERFLVTGQEVRAQVPTINEAPGTTPLGDRVAACYGNVADCGKETVLTDDEDMDADGHSRAPTPWPERWYEGGSELGLQQFAAEVIANCLSHPGDAEAIDDEFGTGQCPTDNDDGHHRQECTGATTTGASSTTGQTTHAGRQPSGGHSTKRQRSNDDGDSEEDPPPKRRDARGPPDNDTGARKFYACPYQKRKPRESPLCGMPHGSKRDFGWDSVSRVKQHLLESHGLDHHCGNCWKAYKKVQDAQGCHETRSCLQRTSPPKHWLSKSQIAHLKAERVASQSDEAWYRIADVLFDKEQDYNPESFRAEHTPFYSSADHLKLLSREQSCYRSPDNTWTPESDSTNPPGLTPMSGNQNVSPAVEGLSAQSMDPSPHQQISGCCDQPGPGGASPRPKEVSEPGMDPDPYRCENPANGHAAPQTPGYFLPEPLVQASTAQHFGAEDMEQFFDLGSAATDLNPPPLPDPFPATPVPAAAACDSLYQFTGTAEVGQLSLACSCGPAQKCICRLKKRVADLRNENESLWAEKEAMRKALVGLRQTLEHQDELLQVMEEKGMLSGEAMGKLYEYQNRMRAVVMEHR
ncbi:uncharacterized protein B0H64DRAFT_398269 [Chaetomium fimeti]|uniref:C2H2-type domain-containing protein n=1 Tax=Chaetomium fimeti TaxID=1854472 RepID=A0AAE0HHQ3_9PEZI|nr:hypothetical protein B0H64DRAFT_398269 [Chaetomium fimeti]